MRNLNRIITEVRPNVEAWPSQTKPKPSVKHSADVQRQPNFSAPLQYLGSKLTAGLKTFVEEWNGHNAFAHLLKFDELLQ